MMPEHVVSLNEGSGVAACSKRSYPSAISAALALRKIQTAHPGRGEVGVHPCFAGHRAWHLTSQPAAAHNRWTVSALAKLIAQAA
jgi:hypothetical protein